MWKCQPQCGPQPHHDIVLFKGIHEGFEERVGGEGGQGYMTVDAECEVSAEEEGEVDEVVDAQVEETGN